MARVMARRRYTARRRPPLLYQQIAPTGMRDSLDPSTADPKKFKLIQNCFPLDPEVGGGLWGRPGFEQKGSQLGSSGNREGQRSYQFTKLDGTEYTVSFVGGKMYTLNWTTGAWTEVVLSGVSLPTSGRVYCCTFGDELVVNPNDGTNKPWTWDGSSFTSLSNADLWYGQPVVHYGKLFGIKWSDPATFQWSEELQANVGYEATIGPTTYDNAWTLGQTDQERLYALVATNNALYYFRARSIGYVLGEVTTNFRSTGTLEGVSTTIGSMSPDSIFVYKDSIYFTDADAHPQRLFAGGGFQNPPIWEDARQTTRLLGKTETRLAAATTTYWADGNLIRFGLVASGGDQPDQELLYDAERGEFVAVWRGYSFSAMDVVKNGSGEPTTMHLSTDGYAYAWGHLWDSIWTDGFAAGAEAISHKVVGTYSGFDTAFEKHFTQLDVSFRRVSDLTGIKVKITTPNGTSSESDLDTITGGLPLWGSATWGQSNWGGGSVESHAPVGLDMTGRWGQVQIRHAGSGERFGLSGWLLQAYSLGAVPEAQ